ncbi:unnamed protein product, partial [marine sediment metagenome]
DLPAYDWLGKFLILISPLTFSATVFAGPVVCDGESNALK